MTPEYFNMLITLKVEWIESFRSHFLILVQDLKSLLWFAKSPLLIMVELPVARKESVQKPKSQDYFSDNSTESERFRFYHTRVIPGILLSVRSHGGRVIWQRQRNRKHMNFVNHKARHEQVSLFSFRISWMTHKSYPCVHTIETVFARLQPKFDAASYLPSILSQCSRKSPVQTNLPTSSVSISLFWGPDLFSIHEKEKRMRNQHVRTLQRISKFHFWLSIHGL